MGFRNSVLLGVGMKGLCPVKLVIWFVFGSLFSVTAVAQDFFLSPVIYPVSSPTALRIADVNGDGFPDLLVGSAAGGGEILVYLGKGHGDFSSPIVLQYGAIPLDIAVADVNGDGKADIIVANGPNQTVSIMLGDGTGHFGQPSNVTFSLPVWRAVAGDVNGDGKIDLAVFGQDQTSNNNPEMIFICLGDGHGGFTQVSQVNAGSGSTVLDYVLADFNEDKKLDLAFIAGNAKGVGVALGDGAGNFGTPTFFGANQIEGNLVVADVNKDGHQDIVSWGSTSPGLIPPAPVVLFGDGTGNFAVQFDAALPQRPFMGSIALADVNGDGNLDLLAMQITGPESDVIDIALGDGKGNFTAQGNPITFGVFGSLIQPVDLAHDGHVDLVLLGAFNNHGFTLPNAIVEYMNVHSSPPLPSSIPTLESSPDLPPAGSPVTFTADVLGAGGSPDGTVTFSDGATVLGSAPVVDQAAGDGLATFMTSLGQGNHSITASYSGSARFVPSVSAAILVMVGPPNSVTTVKSSMNPSQVGQAVTFTANVTGNGGTPAGLLTFRDGGATIGSQQLDVTGSASMVITSFTAGTHPITAQYAGSSSFQSSTSAVIFEQVSGINPPGPDYAFGAAPASATVSAGQSASFTITLMTTGGFNNTVTFACQGLPANSQCQFSPPSVDTSKPLVPVTLTMTTTGSSATLRRGSSHSLVAVLASAVFGLVLLGGGRKRRKLVLSLMTMVVIVCCVSCGGGGGSGGGQTTPPNGATPSGTSQVVVTGTSGSLSHQLPITLTVK